MVDEGGTSAALMDIEDDEERRRARAALYRTHSTRRRRIGFALGLAALASAAIAIPFLRARA